LPRRVLAAVLALQVLYLLSFLYSLSIRAANSGATDLLELLRYLITCGFLFYLMRSGPRLSVKDMTWVFDFSIYYSTFVLVLYLFHIPVLSSLMGNIIYANTKTHIVPGVFQRYGVPFENPNFLGYYLSLLFCWNLFFRQAKWKAVQITLIVLLVYYTGSRTAWAAFLYMTLVWTLGKIWRGARHLSPVALAAPLVLGALLFAAWTRLQHFLMYNSRISLVINALSTGDLGQVTSVGGRLDMIRLA